MDSQRSGLFAALVTARRLTRLHCGNQSFSQRSASGRNECLSCRIEHLWPCQHVASNGEIFKHQMTAPVNTLATRMRSRSPVSTYYMQLTLLAACIGINELTYSLFGREAAGQTL